MDGIRGVTLQPVAGSLSATGAYGGGGGSPEWSWRRYALDSSLYYVYVCAGEQEEQWGW